MSISIILSVEDIKHLPFSLSMLVKQTIRDFEVLLIHKNEAYQKSLELIVASVQQHLDIKILSLPGRSMVQAWEQAVLESAHDFIISIDSATLLNPEAVQSYQRFFKSRPEAIVFGYVSESGDDAEVNSHGTDTASEWFPQQRVNYLDFRFVQFGAEKIEPSPFFSLYPYWFASGNNLGISKTVLNALGPLDAEISSWRRVWVDLCYRANQTYPVYLFLDPWAEYIANRQKSSKRPLNQKKYPLTQAKYPAEVIYRPQKRSDLLAYIQKSHAKEAAAPHRKITLSDSYAQIGHYHLTQRPPDRVPDFLIIGAQKAGTTSLYNYLQVHSDLIPARTKEVNFFGNPEHYEQGLDWYLDHFYFEENKLSYEVTPNYLFQSVAAERIAKHLPNTKLIVILRDPVERAYSSWNMYRNFKPTSHLFEARSFEEAIEDEFAGIPGKNYLARGLYYSQLTHYLKYFKQSNLLILDFEELKTEPDRVLKKCFHFLNLKDLDSDFQLPPKANQGQYQSTLDPELEKKLKHYFLEPNFALKQFFDLPFKWLN